MDEATPSDTPVSSSPSEHGHERSRKRRGHELGANSPNHKHTVHMQHFLQKLVARSDWRTITQEVLEFARTAKDEIDKQGKTDLLLDRIIVNAYMKAEAMVVRAHNRGFISYVGNDPAASADVREARDRVKFLIQNLHEGIYARFDSYTFSIMARELFRLYLEMCVMLGDAEGAKRGLNAMQGAMSTSNDARAHLLVARTLIRPYLVAPQIRLQLDMADLADLREAADVLDRANELCGPKQLREYRGVCKDLLLAWVRCCQMTDFKPLAAAYARWRAIRRRLARELNDFTDFRPDLQTLQMVAQLSRQGTIDDSPSEEASATSTAADGAEAGTSGEGGAGQGRNVSMALLLDLLTELQLRPAGDVPLHVHDRIDEGTLLMALNACVRGKDSDAAHLAFRLLKDNFATLQYRLSAKGLKDARRPEIQQIAAERHHRRLPLPASYHAVITAYALAEPHTISNTKRFEEIFRLVAELARDYAHLQPHPRTDASFLDPYTSLLVVAHAIGASPATLKEASSVLEAMRMAREPVCTAQYNMLIMAAALLPSPMDANGVDISADVNHPEHPFTQQINMMDAIDFYHANGHPELEANTQTFNAVIRCLSRFDHKEGIEGFPTVMEDRGIPRDEQTYEPILWWQRSHRMYRNLVQTFEEVKALGLTLPHKVLLASYHDAVHDGAPEQHDLGRFLRETGSDPDPRRSYQGRYSKHDRPRQGDTGYMQAPGQHKRVLLDDRGLPIQDGR